jgi:hypothetical protein
VRRGSVGFRRDSPEALHRLDKLGLGCVADQVDRLLFLVHDGADASSLVLTRPRIVSSSGIGDQFPPGRRSSGFSALPITPIGVPSRRVDPIQYVAPSSRYDSLPVSSGHQVGSKTAVPKLSVSASAVLKRFGRARTIFVVILGPPSFSSSRSALRPCVGSSGDGVAEPSESGS